MTKYLSAAETAKVVRKILKSEFPGIKFSVRSESYSMGSSVRVSWEDGPTTKQVDEAVGILSGSGFDGMIDLKYNITHWLLPDGTFALANSSGSVGSGGCHEGFNYPKPHPDAVEVSFADHISTSRNYSTEFLEALIKGVSAKFGSPAPEVNKHAFGPSLTFKTYSPEVRDMERTYWVIQSNSEIVNGKIVCHDHIYGEFFNSQKAEA